MQLCLGTVQFGMDYGVQGQKRPEPEAVFRILDTAIQEGVRALDTAAAYGEAEAVLGAFLQRKTFPRAGLEIVSKLAPTALDGASPEQYKRVIRRHVEDSLRRLHTDYLDGYLLHDARYVSDPQVIEALDSLRREGLAGKVGASVYEVEEARQNMAAPALTLMQLPYSLLDQRMKEGDVFREAIEKDTQIHCRSVFTQGLVLMQEDALPPYLQKAAPVLRKLDAFCCQYGLSREEIAMAYVKQEKAISHLVFGVDNLEQLRANIALFQQEPPTEILAEIGPRFANLAPEIVVPKLWKK